ncbi:GNAT family N-acetyltransferase [Cellulosilyticum ruminicola]|uniref:GNAT family N-acetyltransferase n=1 Tax=Cellulosilyticum ruminicola TaxID=425254 RepID=UPI0006D15E38|nr:GNAT family N-acetyltransferase [Cellulosilyticum ruminicola]
MEVMFRKYNDEPRFSEDYYKVREFLLKLNHSGYLFGRWDWMITHGMLDCSVLKKIGLWEDEGKLVAVALFDTELGNAFCYTLPEYHQLKKEVFEYAKENFKNGNDVSVMVSDKDTELQEVAKECGFVATEDKEADAVYKIDLNQINVTLPEGFKLTTLKETYDLAQYGEVLWKGFNHELDGEGSYVFTEEEQKINEAQMQRPNVDLSLKIVVTTLEGEFVAYCGMWYDPTTKVAVVEPVATVPKYRKMGLGKAAVLEGIRQCGLRGAELAYVGSSQQFYYNIGFVPCSTNTWWKEKNK